MLDPEKHIPPDWHQRESQWGIQHLCSGESPADGLGFVTVNENETSEVLQIYSLNEYWENPFTSYCKDSRPFWLELDEKYIHFYHFTYKKITFCPHDKARIEELVPEGYILRKSFTANGSDASILRRINK